MFPGGVGVGTGCGELVVIGVSAWNRSCEIRQGSGSRLSEAVVAPYSSMTKAASRLLGTMGMTGRRALIVGDPELYES